MFCHKCGKEIDDDSVVCVHCGVKTKNFDNENANLKPINIVNQSSSTSSNTEKHVPIVYNGVVDFIMIWLTCGLWFIVMLVRPKYR